MYGRGGQGVVTAGRLIVEAAFLNGYWGRCTPLFGAERRGAPVSAFLRLSKGAVRRRCAVREPDIIAVFDPKVLSVLNLGNEMSKVKVLVINSKEPLKDVKCKQVTVDAFKIAEELGLIVSGWPAVNSVMLGAMVKALPEILTLDNVVSVVSKKWRGDIGAKNVEAVKRGYEEAVVIEA